MRWRGRLPLVALAAVCALLLPSGPAAREQRSVFHGLPTDPETAFKPIASKNPVDITRVWMFDDFRAPLTDRLDGDARRILAADQSGDVAALDPASGAVIWRVHLGETLAIGPELAGESVLQGTAGGAIIALDAGDGHTLWRSELGGAAVAPPLAIPGRLLVATEKPELVAIDPATGARLGRLPLPGRPVAPTLAGGILAVGTDHGMVLAIDPGTLEVRWRRYMRMAVTAPPLVQHKRVYVAVADRTLRSLKISSGRQVWRQRTGAIATAGILAAGDYVYVQCWDDDIYVVRSRNGHLAARIHLDHRLSLDAVRAQEYLFVAPFTEGSVVALSLPGLTLAGKFHLDAPGEWFTTPPVLAGERVAVGSGRDAGRILALEVKPAAKKDEAAADKKPAATPATPPAASPGG